MAAIILAGDVGGTKIHLGLYRAEGSTLVPLRDQIYATRHYPSLQAAIADFVAGREHVAAACLGVAGPVIDGVSDATNVPWVMSEKTIAGELGGTATRLMNDLEATAYGVVHLDVTELLELQKGQLRERTNAAVIAAGTGLGEAAIIATAAGWQTIASEGGHCDFAPRGQEQYELLSFLGREFDHVSFERVLSGPGLHNIYRFLVATEPEAEPQWLVERMRSEDPSAVISATALAEKDARCMHALEIFTAIYGSEAANVALKFLALGGVYVAGGIAPKILPYLERGCFVRAFLDKGRFRSTLEKIPIRVALNPNAGLIGAAHMAALML